MNDFTKEDLEAILALYNNATVGTYIPELGSLMAKVESMIENYCEHQKMDFVGDVYGYDCIKCGKQFTGRIIDGDRHAQIIRGEE